MRPSRDEVLARERRWALPVALATLAGVALGVAAFFVGAIGGESDAEVLRSVDEHSAAVTASGVMQCIAFLLLVAPLLYLFRAVQARSERVRGQLAGLVIAAPLFLAVAAILTAVATTDAASDFVAGEGKADLTAAEAREECVSERRDDAAAFRDDFGGGAGSLQRCAAMEITEARAQDVIVAAPTRGVATGFALGGRIGLAFALLYTCLWALRTGLLSRFWGSLGMAMGAAALLLLPQLTLIWFLYLGLLVAGWVPGGRPPAWAAGEAIPWPTPGERTAEELAGAEDGERRD
ncbi:MAG TPA: hypothetical protein VF729_04095 [Solirubrobacterales bacterium]